ncbi:MAG: PAS domain-containing sensor histidine kinase [Nitrospirae bacterium CG_4_10_14_3_um_filter_53_41]|nr:MAG: PAS domain-containing sensor histidine kinase [Nitrospirae bacterium CG_4_10_14_3_um_filter_53_41]
MADRQYGSERSHSSHRFRPKLFVILGILALIGFFFRFRSKLENSEKIRIPVSDYSILLALAVIITILSLVLILMVFRNLIKYYFEGRKVLPRARIKTKLIIAFIGFSVIPSVLLFTIASFLITTSIDNWFNKRVEDSLEESMDVAKVYYKNSELNALYYGRQISEQITENKLLNEVNLKRLRELINQKQKEYNLGVVEVFSATHEELVKAMNPEVPSKTFVGPRSEIIEIGFKGKEHTESEPMGEGDIIRGVVPVVSSFNRTDVVGVIVVNYYVQKSLANKMMNIISAFDEYRRQASLKNPKKALYIMVLFLGTLVIAFSAIWVGLYLARKITIPIQELTGATHRIAEGDLDFVIDVDAKDELGVLMDSFNRMMNDLKGSKENLERTNIELKVSNEELDRRRSYIETILQNIDTGVISMDWQGRITTINRAVEQMLGIRMVDARGKDYRDIFKFPKLLESIQMVTTGHQKSFGRDLKISTEQKTLHVKGHVTSLEDDRGNYLGAVVVLDDFTELAKAQKAAAWREVARRIAHEIKNPLTPIQLSAQRLLRKHEKKSEDLDEVIRDCTSTIISEVEGMKKLVNEFSEFAKMPDAQPSPNDLHVIVEEAATLYEGHKGIEIIKELDEKLPILNIDKEQIRRALINLLENAVEAMSDHGRIWIRTCFNPGLKMATLEVRDEGTGIRPEDKEKLFLPYFSRKKSGTGLGLSIVDRIVKDHGGYIRVKDNKPKGTMFVIELPVAA